MTYTSDERLTIIAKALMPTGIAMVGVILLTVPIGHFGAFLPVPFIAMAVVYFWSLYAPNYMPPISIFSIGLWQDFLLGGPLGVWAAAYLISHYLVLAQRDYLLGRETHVVWLGFGITSFLIGGIVWGANSMYLNALFPIWPLIWQIGVTVLFYRALVMLFSGIHRKVVSH